MFYSRLVDAYESISRTTKRLEITSLLVGLLKQTPPTIIDKVVYLTQGKLYPDYLGIEVGIAEKLAIKCISAVAGTTEQKVTAEYKAKGDLGTAVEELLGKKTQVALREEPLTVEDVYNGLDRIARSAGSGSLESKIRQLTGMLGKASPVEAKYLIRSDLGLLSKRLASGGIKDIESFKITVGIPVRPMLAERLPDAKAILEKMDGTAAAEYKYDGLRIQAHLSHNGITMFSRRLENITEQFPDIQKLLKQGVGTGEIVLEGETVPVDNATGDLLPFQLVSQRRGRKYELEKTIQEIPVAFFTFDLLFANGIDYTAKPYPKRRRALEKLVRSGDRLGLSRQMIVRSAEQLDDFMQQAIADGCEGLMIKSVGPDSIYKAGSRGWAWVKYKREYKSEMQDTVDLAVVGAFAGRGRRGGAYGALLLAAYDKNDDVFRTVCKCGSGLTDEDLN